MEIWFSYSDIVFSREQIFVFILPNRRMMKEGNWPPLCKEDNCEAKHGGNQQAPFMNAVVIIGEVEARLKTTGEAGEALLGEIDAGIDYLESLSPPARRALNYISGHNRRTICFPFWLCLRNFEKEETLKEPCKCGANRWRTVKKGLSWRCRKCGQVRNSQQLLDNVKGIMV